MITESFDDKSEAIIIPEAFYGASLDVCDVAIATFSREIYSEVLQSYPNEQIAEIRMANRIRPVYLLKVEDMKIAFYLSEIGATLAATDVIDVCWITGARSVIMFGSAGALDDEQTNGKYVIPTAAYRDEGMSYHYAPASDYIDIKNAEYLEHYFSNHDFPYVKGKIWTTDAIYRETRGMMQIRKEEGCLAVEMEIAGVQAVCDYYGFELYTFIVTGDVVDQTDYTPEGLHTANHSTDKFDIALMIATKLLDSGE